MNYSKEEFYDLMEQAEEQGADHLDEICIDQTYEFGNKVRPVTMRGCRNSALFLVPYEDSISRVTDSGTVKVCAVDDDMARWPRFGGDRFGREVDTNA